MAEGVIGILTEETALKLQALLYQLLERDLFMCETVDEVEELKRVMRVLLEEPNYETAVRTVLDHLAQQYEI